MRVSGVALCVLLVSGCGDHEDLVFAVPLASGPATLTLSDDGTALTFARGERVLLTMRGDAFAVGTVDDIDSGAIEQPRHGGLVGRKDRDLCARGLHRAQIGYSNRLHAYKSTQKSQRTEGISFRSVPGSLKLRRGVLPGCAPYQ